MVCQRLTPSVTTIHKRDDHGTYASGITAHQATLPSEGSVPSRGPEGIEQDEQRQSQRDAGRPRRLALVAGLTSVSLLAAGLVLQSSLTGGTLGTYTANSAPRSLAVLPHNPGVREPPLLPRSPGVHGLLHSVQWVQTAVFDQFLPGKPLTVSLPQLQRTPASLPVTVTLEVSDSTPKWLTFDPEKLALSGTAPPQEIGKTYHLTFRARTADGLESLLHFVLTIK
jgi:Putative Ig domain